MTGTAASLLSGFDRLLQLAPHLPAGIRARARAAAAAALPVLAPLLVLPEPGAGDLVLLALAFACAAAADAAVGALAAARPQSGAPVTFALALVAGLLLFGVGFASLLALACLATAALESRAREGEIAGAALLLCAAALRVDAGTVALGAVRDLALVGAVAPTALFFSFTSEQATLVLGRPRRRAGRALRDALSLAAAAAALGGWLHLAARAADGVPAPMALVGLPLLAAIGLVWLLREELAVRVGGMARVRLLLAILALLALAVARLALVHPPGLPLPA
ncbi:hypothetical protein HRbin39_00601 [bacterium HR39]|nr:hypothetical protein HRbin39_00601 [bacterium HR39]